MAIRLPTAADLGFNDPTQATPLPSFPESDPAATALRVAGAGVEQFGGAALHAADYLDERRQAANETRATLDFLPRFYDRLTKIETATDPAQVAELAKGFGDDLNTSAQAIDDPTHRSRWMATHSTATLHAQMQASERAFSLNKQAFGVSVQNQLDAVARSTADKGPDAISTSFLAADNAIEDAVKNQGLSPEWGYRLRKSFQDQTVRGTADNLINQGKPLEAVDLLDKHRYAVNPVTLEVLRGRAQAKAESLAGETTADWIASGGPARGEAYPGPRSGAETGNRGVTFGGAIPNRIAETAGIPPLRPIPSQYAPLVEQAAAEYGVPQELLARTIHAESSFNPAAVSPTGARGIAQFITSTAEQYGVDRSDPKSSIMGAANYLSDLHQRTGSWQGALKGYLGSDPWQAKSYKANGAIQLASVLDSGKAPAASSDAPAQAALGTQAASIAAPDQPPTDTGDTAGAGTTGGGPNRTGLMPLGEADRIIDGLPLSEAGKKAARDSYARRYLREEADASRSARIADQQQKALVNQATDRIYADVYSGNPQITASDIANSPAFSADEGRRRQMLELLDKPPGMSVPAARSQQTAMSLIDRIRLPSGDPQKITEEGDVFAQQRNLNRPDLEFALKQLRDNRAPGGETLRQKRDSFFKQYSQYITKSNPLSGIGDPVGNGRLFELENYVDQKIEAYRTAKRNPLDLFDPKNPDFPGSPEVIRYFQPTMQQSMDSTNQWASGTPTPLPPVGTVPVEPGHTPLPTGYVMPPQPRQMPLAGGGTAAPIQNALPDLGGPPVIAPPAASAAPIPNAAPPVLLKANPFLVPPPANPGETIEQYRARTGL